MFAVRVTAICGSCACSTTAAPYRVLYAFDPRRAAILLLGGDKTGNDRWYVENVPTADAIYDKHLEVLTLEGLLPPEKKR